MDLLLEGEQTERMLFRKVHPSDFEAWLPFHEDKRSSEFWEGLPSDPKIACQQQFDRIFERYENNLGGMNALISKSTGEFIGLCGLLKQTVDEVDELEIGYSILPKYWKQGYASEAAIKCKNFAKERTLAKSLISIIHIENLPSQKVALKNGMYLDKTTTYQNNPVNIFRVLL
ncbi:GNAT family N-acetyltransferase [Zobellia uliginosa]|uniref:GNAT family N-acetyltransferase n=1 Tax=Zobellia uliginosa TaxID=143224 RepID=UPI001C06BB53|nr:GNAT family N-acetyltransferase [Zobellia uliginosa]MBU2947193.1 GNAT family N-acetyltransferase [Zobellia uliginosa]